MPQLQSLLTTSTLAIILAATPAQANPLQNWAGRLLEWSQKGPTANITSVTGFIPPTGELPGNREGGAARGAICPFSNQRLTALLPSSNLSLTAAARPSLFFYLPPTEGRSVEFLLKNNQGTKIYQKTTKINQSGIVRVEIPTNAPELAVGQNYQWYLSVICNQKNRTADLYIQGWVQRVNISNNLQQQLQQASARNRPYIYASAGLWHETLATLFELRQTQPENNNFKSNWMSLLQMEGLDKVAREPLVGTIQAHGQTGN